MALRDLTLPEVGQGTQTGNPCLLAYSSPTLLRVLALASAEFAVPTLGWKGQTEWGLRILWCALTERLAAQVLQIETAICCRG